MSIFSLFSQDVKKPTSPALTLANIIEWSGDSEFTLGGVKFFLSFDTNELNTWRSNSNTFLLGKPKHMVEKSIALQASLPIRKVFEMGILRGGSVVFYDQLFHPDHIIAIDHNPNPVDELDDYIQKYHRQSIVKPYYGVSQDDRIKMQEILSHEFPLHDLDLIIDDASHLYSQTRQAFNICFPYLAEGGLYIIEDWAWAHWSGDYWQAGNSYFDGKPALSNLIIELCMLSASRPDLIQEILIDHNVVIVRKGKGILPKEEFDIADHYLLRGKKFEPWL